jgi:hypothetical protein
MRIEKMDKRSIFACKSIMVIPVILYLYSSALLASVNCKPPAVDGVVCKVPDNPDADGKYLFYVHSSGPDMGKSRSIRKVEEKAQAFRKYNATLVMELRPKKDWKFPDGHEAYAKNVSEQVARLIAAGVKPENITVSGYSRGGMITLITSAYVGNDNVNYVVLNSCIAKGGKYRDQAVHMERHHYPNMKGRLLSIWETGDRVFGSCESAFDMAMGLSEKHELKTSAGGGHFSYVDVKPVWFRPLIEWASLEPK